jgi:hypothetical protein
MKDQDVKSPNRGVIALCVLACAVGLLLVVHAVTSGMHEMQEDEKMELVDLDDKIPEELEAERLSRETDELRAEKERLQAECSELEQRLVAISAQAPPMPKIQTWVAASQKDFAFLAVGSTDKVERGFQFTITRKKEFVARVVVQAVDERACACRVLVTKEGDRICVGDDAETATK